MVNTVASSTRWFDRPDQREFAELVRSTRRRWLVTGAAGFIGSNLVESLLLLGQEVVGLDNFATGHRHNLDHVRASVGDAWSHFRLVEGDIRAAQTCAEALDGVDIVLHQAALGSVPRSIEDPLTSHDVNVSGFLTMLDAARLAGVSAFVYAASSSTYGDEPNLPKVEERIGNPLSPYAATKLFNEIYAEIYWRTYGFATTGLRYFNVFGPRQDPDGAYAAVIPKWTDRMIRDEDITINGDGLTSRDFCFVDNAVQANLRSALIDAQSGQRVFNVAVGEQTSLNELVTMLRDQLASFQIHYSQQPHHAEARKGDVRHSLADISKASGQMGYKPTHTIAQGLEDAMPWYVHERAELLKS